MDEAKLELLANNDRRYVWRASNTAFEEKNMEPIVKHGGGRIMIWVCFAAVGTGKIVRTDGTLDTVRYQRSSVRKLDFGRC